MPLWPTAVGERWWPTIVAWLGAEAQELLADYDAARPSRLRTFDDVETFWDEEIRPILPDFASLKGSWTEADAPAEGSRWREGWIPQRY